MGTSDLLLVLPHNKEITDYCDVTAHGIYTPKIAIHCTSKRHNGKWCEPDKLNLYPPRKNEILG